MHAITEQEKPNIMDNISRGSQPIKRQDQSPNSFRGTQMTAGLIYGGGVIAVIATFLPFATVSYQLFGTAVAEHDVSANGAAKFAAFLLVAVAAWLARPTLSGSHMAVNRLVGISTVVCLLVGLMLVWFASVGSQNDGGGAVDVSPGFGLFLYAVGVIAIAVGVVRVWINRSNAPAQGTSAT
jgi:hypothetical protein